MIELHLTRNYLPEGTNGTLEIEGRFICYSIELPWLHNVNQESCIPEGNYELAKRYSKKFDWHLQLLGVKDRSLILIHPANDAKTELMGCIAPVSKIIGPGKGIESKVAFKKLKNLVYPLLEIGEKVCLTIKS